jgi:nucleotide-binding universal stress UspA family protein
MIARTVAQIARDRNARAIIMGIGRHAPMDRLLGEELTLQTLRLADCPVLAVAGSWTELPRRAVVAVDFSAASVRAAEEALALLADGGTLTLLHVRPSFDEMLRPASEVWIGAHRQRLTELLDRLRHALAAPADVTVETLVLAGDPAAEVLAYSARVGAPLVATGSTGRGFFARLVVGSVATQLLRASPVSVLAVPTPNAEETDRIERLLASTRETSEAAQWPAMIAMFSRQNAGRPTRLEVDDPSLGAQTQECGYALVGATYDRRDGRLELMLGDVVTGARRLTHSVGGVRSLAVRTEPDGRDETLQVCHGAGQTMLTFRD